MTFFIPRKVKVDVHNELERRDITNVIGVIHGREEPGNHTLLAI